MGSWLLLLGVGLGLLSALLALLSVWLRRSTGLPAGPVVYTDLPGERGGPPLRAPRYRLIGRPDLLLYRDEGVIPVEVKGAPAPERPHPSHVLQLMAYCLLVEEALDVRPPYGLLRYRDRTFALDYTEAQREALLRVLEAMQQDLTRGEAHRQHRSAARCRACGFREICEEALE